MPPPSPPPGAEVSPLDTPQLRPVLGTFATGVTIVTVGGTDPHGMTANSFTSVSLDPPLILICLEKSTRTLDGVVAAGTFAVSVLAADQDAVARHFARRMRPSGPAGFGGVPCVDGPHTGAPLVRDAAAWLECALWRTYDGGDHAIVVGRLLSVRRVHDRPPLLFYCGQFHHGPITAASA
ncbi:flavin reductase family protein [Micromonospora sp. NPDC023814]|uniref:flavin reductase family protein n=1 Tax=Micromonospora sp. NPDC023814 TaxID=3154596 RepID=UPI0033EE0DD2